MKRVFLFLFLLAVELAHAQSALPRRLNLTPTSSFFADFVFRKPSERGEFETKAEYEKRIPRHPDTSKIYFFKIDAIPPDVRKNYSYNVEEETLSVIGGKCNEYWYRNYKPENGAEVVISTRHEEQKPYKASNAFGKSVTVRKVHRYEYTLSFVNWADIPHGIRSPGCGFQLSISRPPKEAEKLSRNLSLVVGITVLDYQRSVMECVSTTEPKIGSPLDIAVFSYLIEAKFVSVSLFDENSKKILSHFELAQ